MKTAVKSPAKAIPKLKTAKPETPNNDDAEASKARHSASQLFGKFASFISTWAGHPATFAVAVLLLLIWAAFGPILDYSTAWQLLVNTGTTICTFLMVFIIQNSQNRDGLAAQIKLDEIIRAIKGARNTMIDLENLTDEELRDLHERFSRIALLARHGKAPPGDAVQEEIAEREEPASEKIAQSGQTQEPRA